MNLKQKKTILILDSEENVKVLSNRIGSFAGNESSDCIVNSILFQNAERIPSNDNCKICSCQNGQVIYKLDRFGNANEKYLFYFSKWNWIRITVFFLTCSMPIKLNKVYKIWRQLMFICYDLERIILMTFALIFRWQ